MASSSYSIFPALTLNAPLAKISAEYDKSWERGALIRFAFHAGAAAIMQNGYAGLVALSRVKQCPPEYGGFFQYLTVVGLTKSTGAMVASTLCDLFPGIPALELLKRVSLLFSLPTEVAISIVYWTIALFIPSMRPPVDVVFETASGLMVQPAQDLVFHLPVWMDLSIHLVPALALILDFFILEKKFKAPMSTWGILILATITGVSYPIWIEYCASINGKFPYPILTEVGFSGRMGAYVGVSTVALTSFFFLNWLHK